jgi:putative ATP-dependent endonuclease of OLD family
MKIRKLQIHNFRSIADQIISLGDYSLLIGANNSGKSNVVDVLRVLYEKDLKFVSEHDFPKFATTDEESWIDAEYELTADEAANLKAEYLIGGKSLSGPKMVLSSRQGESRSIWL